MEDARSASVPLRTDAAYERFRRFVRIALSAVFLGVAVRANAQTWRQPRDSAAARDSSKAKIDSLAARLERAESEIELLRQQMSTESSTGVRTRSRLQVDIWARVLMNGFVSRGTMNSADVPTMATDDTAKDAGRRSLGFSLRQTRVGLSLFVDSVAGAAFDGDFEVDFFGGSQTATTADSYMFPQPRLRTAKFTMRWPRTELLIGGETPLISGQNPITVASVGEPGFSDAGNLWNWLPQLRVTRELATTSFANTPIHWAIQGAVLHPFAGFQLASEEYGVDAGVRSGRPYLESRLRARWGADADEAGASPGDPGGEIGFGVHHGWIHVAGDTLTTSSAVSVDARIGLVQHVELRGEAYRGRALAGLGGGGIDQNFGIAAPGLAFGAPLDDTGGWAQINWRMRATLMGGAGCGVDAPDANDRPDRQRNEACAAHMLWRPAQPVLFGLELRRLRTTYATRVAYGTHLNFAFGFEL